MLGSKTVISKSTFKITFPRGDLLNTLSVKVPERKFQRETNPGTKKQTVQLDGWPSWTERATISAIESGRCEEIGFAKLTALLERVGLEIAVAARRGRPTIDDLLAERRGS